VECDDILKKKIIFAEIKTNMFQHNQNISHSPNLEKKNIVARFCWSF